MPVRIIDGSTDRLLTLVDRVHAAPLRPGGWMDALTGMREMFGIPYVAHMIRTDNHSHRTGMASGASAADYQAMLDTYFTGSVYFQRPYPLFTGQIAASRDMASREEILGSAIFQGWNKDHDVHEMLRLALRVGGGVAEVVTLGAVPGRPAHSGQRTWQCAKS